MPDGKFTVGPPAPISDPRRLPAVSAEEEADFVRKANRDVPHPDNEGADEPDFVPVHDLVGVQDLVGAPPPRPLGLLTAADEQPGEDEDLPSEDELAELVADVDVDDIDPDGFDDTDEESAEIDVTDPVVDRVGGGS